MDFEQVLTLRRSVRRFQDKEIPETLIRWYVPESVRPLVRPIFRIML